LQRNLTREEVNLITSLEGVKRLDLEVCKDDESLFPRGLESFRISFDYKVKLVSKLRKIFDKVKYQGWKNEKQFLTANDKFAMGF